MIVDFHTHTFPERIAAPTIQKLAHMSHIKPFSDGSNSGLAASMAAAGVDYSVVLPVATNPRQVCHVNDSAAQVNESTEIGNSYDFTFNNLTFFQFCQDIINNLITLFCNGESL